MAKETKAQSTEVAVKSAQSIEVALTAEFEDMLLDTAGAGFEETSQEDRSTPRLKIVQKTSPEASKGNSAYVKGAEAGTIMNTSSKSLVDGEKGVLVIPCFFAAVVMEWKPKPEGGLAGIHHRDEVKDNDLEDYIDDKGKRKQRFVKTGNDAVPTKNHYALVLGTDAEGNPDGTFEPVLIPMKSTHLKCSTAWMNLMDRQMLNGKRLAMFTNIYRLTTVFAAKGEYDWYEPRIEHVSRLNNDQIGLFKAAKSFYESLAGNLDQVKKDTAADNANEVEGRAEPATDLDADLPF